MNVNCPFCELQDEEVVRECSNFLALKVKYHPFDEKHLLVIPKDHITSYKSIDLNMLSDLYDMLANLKRDYFSDQSIVIAEMGGIFQSIPHAHFHIFPQKIKGHTLEIFKYLEDCSSHSERGVELTQRETSLDRLSFKKIINVLQGTQPPYVLYTDLHTCITLSGEQLDPAFRLRTIISSLTSSPELLNWKRSQ